MMRVKVNPSKMLTLLMLLSFTLAWGQGINKVGTTSFQFLKIIPEARGTSMAGAYTSVSSNSDALFWNPALITEIKDVDVSASYLDYLLDVSHQSITAVYTIESIGTFGIMGMMNQMGAIKETDARNLYYDSETGTYNPGLTGNSFTPGFFVLGLSYARKITDKFSFGMTAKYANEDLVYADASQFMFDFGLLYKTGYKSLQLGASIRHFGPKVKFVSKSYALPQTLNVGLSGYLIDRENGILSDMENHQLLLSFDLSQTRDHAQQTLLGLEYGLFNMIFIRGGYKFNFDEEGLTFGGGVNISGFRVSYSYNDFGEYFDAIHRITVAFGTK